MNILVINPILYTPEHNKIPIVSSIKDTMIYNVCLGLQRQGHNVTLIAAQDYKPTENEDYPFDIIWLDLYFKHLLPATLPICKGLHRYIKINKNNIDLIISSESFSVNSLIASLLLPSKTAIWHELALHQHTLFKLPSRFWYNIVVRFLMRKVIIIPRSERAFNFIRRYHTNTSYEFVEHGINIEKFVPSKFKSNSFIIIGQLIPRKNIGSIIKIFARFVNKIEYADYVLNVVGRGPLEQELRELAKTLGISDKVVFRGFLSHNELLPYLSSAKACLINTLHDNNMVSIPETIACGTPILTNSIPTNTYIIRNNELGIVKDNWSEKDLIEIVENNDLYKSNCTKYRKNLSIEFCSERLISISEQWKILIYQHK